MKRKLYLVIMGCLVLLATSSWAQPGGGPGVMEKITEIAKEG